MLIICPECNNKISDQSEVCIYCGFPLKNEIEKSKDNICIIDGISRDLTEQFENIFNPNYKPLYKFGHEYNMNILDASMLYELIKTFMFIPKEYNSSQRESYRSILNAKLSQKHKSNIPKCPTCGSTNIEKISVTKKAFGGAMFGLFSSDVRNSMHCKICGAKW